MVITTEPLANVPLSPPAPKDVYFSDEQQAWVLSRHQDVLAALRSTGLSQARPPAASGKLSSKQGSNKVQEDVITGIPSPRSSKWQLEINRAASAILRALPRHRPLDLVADFIRPWCLSSALTLTGVDAAHGQRLAQLVKYLSDSDAAPNELEAKYRAREANEELNRFFPALCGKSMFVGAAQTVPTFLASAWAALLLHPAKARELQQCPGWIPLATEELLRYAGPVHTLFRQADRAIEISGRKIERGDRLILRLSSANRDPEQFSDPDRLDFTRDVAGHLALSAGSHYCIGASIVRIMTATANRAILNRYLEPQLSSPVEWSCGTMLIWPSALPVLLGNSLDYSA